METLQEPVRETALGLAGSLVKELVRNNPVQSTAVGTAAILAYAINAYHFPLANLVTTTVVIGSALALTSYLSVPVPQDLLPPLSQAVAPNNASGVFAKMAGACAANNRPLGATVFRLLSRIG